MTHFFWCNQYGYGGQSTSFLLSLQEVSRLIQKSFPKDVGKGLATLQNAADTLQGFADQVRSEMPQVNAISVAPSGYTTVQSENDGRTHRGTQVTFKAVRKRQCSKAVTVCSKNWGITKGKNVL